MTQPSSPDALDYLADILACLRTLQQHYYTIHWQAGGLPYYGDHLLYQRLYEDAGKEFDTLAEKMTAYFGPRAVELDDQFDRMNLFVKSWSRIDDPVEKSIKAEKDLQHLLEDAYDGISESGEMSLGLDDWLMATANAHETNLYLLERRKTSGTEASVKTSNLDSGEMNQLYRDLLRLGSSNPSLRPRIQPVLDYISDRVQ